MKRLINILMTAVVLIGLAASCEKAPKVAEGIVGGWKLLEMTGYEAANLPQVYVEFNADLSFTIYQKVGDVPRYRKYQGQYLVTESVVSGEYADGEKWGSSYRAAFEADGEILVLTALEMDKQGNVLSEGEVCRYTKASLSQEEKDAADVVTRSAEETPCRFL